MYRNIKVHPILRKKAPVYLFLFLMAIFGLSSCQSFKGTKIYYFWHNMNARFNGYFNAKEKLLDIENTLFDQKVDNFNRIIDVFAITDEKTKETYKKDLDVVITKASTVITKHGTSKWVKNCYFLIGKAEFYKRDFFTAIETFEYVNEKYPDDPLGHASKVWLMQCYLEQNKMNDVLSMIAAADSDKNFPEEQKPYLHLVEADYYIRTNDYKKAIKKLESVVPVEKDRGHKTRYMFILAQLYQALGNTTEASKYYTMVVKRHPSYDLLFQAKLRLSEVSNDPEAVEKSLLKLLKDERNVDYKDQIYYTLAKIELKKGHKDASLDYLKLSTAASKKNDIQKALSYKTEAEIYFSIPVYASAKMFYDSAAKFITKDYPDYDAFKARQAVLSDLISNLITLHLQDSLLKISNYDTAVLNALIDKEIATNKQGVPVKNAPIALPGGSEPMSSFPLNDNSGNNKGGYFYNSEALAQGNNEFISKWGNRPLADDWRRKSKPAVNEETQNGTSDTAAAGKNNEPLKTTAGGVAKNISAQRKRYYQDIPFNQSQKNIANNKIQEALYNIGDIYYNGLGDYKQAEATFEELLQRFPKGTYAVQTHYNLYKVYLADSNKTKSDYHKSIVLNDFPGSVYAQLIVNPDQLRQQYMKSRRNDELENAYNIAYQHFNANDCEALRNDIQQANSRFSKNYLKAKFEYLYVICQGKKDSIDNFIISLKGFLKKYPGEEISPAVNNQILYLEDIQKKRKEAAMSKDSARAKSMVLGSNDNTKVEYQKTENQPHQFIIIVPTGSNVEGIKRALGDYDNENYQSQQLTIQTFPLGNDRFVIMVKNYKDDKQALQYYKDLENTSNFYTKLALKYHQEFIISDTNFGLLMKHNDVEGYVKFFKENYLQ